MTGVFAWRALVNLYKQLNQVIARQDNIEEALLTAMTYVGPNSIRAKTADTPEQSKHTSIKPNFSLTSALANNPDFNPRYIQRFSVKPLAALEGNVKHHNQNGVLFSHRGCLTLIDTTGHIQRQDKRDLTPETFLPILQRLAIDCQ